MHNLLKTKNITNLKILAVSALFAAISFICGKFLAISIGETIRFSFENLPLMLTSFMFGPTVGAVTAVTADIVGCLLRGYAINPILTLAAAFIGFFSGLFFNALKSSKLSFRVTMAVAFCHFFGSILLKTVGLSVWLGYPFFITLLSRALNYMIVFAAELPILILILKNKQFMGEISKLTGENNELR